MNQFFTWSPDAVARTLGFAVAALVGVFAIIAWRGALLVKLGTRNIVRRRLRAVVIVLGLTLGTTVVGSAFGTGDSLTHTLQTLVAGSLGTVDEVIVLNPPRTRLVQQVRALATPGLGGLAAADLQFFAQEEFSSLAQATRGSEAIAALAPGIVDQVSVVNTASQQLRSGIALLAVGAPYPAAFGPLQTSDGAAVPLESLAADEVVLNAAAADTLGAVPGGSLDILHDGTTWSVRVRAVVENGGLSGLQPLVLVPLPNYQRVVGQEGQINHILVVNRGGTASVARSADAARDLRQLLVNRPVAEQLHTLLGRPEIQRSLQDVESVVPERERARLAALRAEAAQPEVTPDFISMITDPRVRSRLLGVARRVGGSARGATPLLENVASLSVLPLKQEALDQAQEWGAVITTVFLLLGIFSIAAAILLIFLIFALLAADRSAELATVRAIGMRRHQVMGMFLSEGLVYNVAGAALGTLASLVSGYAIVTALAGALDPFGVQLDAQAEPRSLLIAFSGGVLLTFGTMLVAAWRVSDVDIVAATRGEQIDGQRWRVIVGFLLLLVAGVLWWRWRSITFPSGAFDSILLPSAVTLTLLGTLACIGALQLRGAWRQQFVDILMTVGGVAIGAVWLWTLMELPSARGNVRNDVVAVALGGVVLSVAAGWTAVRVVGPLIKLLDQAVGAPTIRAVLRPAAGYLSGERWRTGLTVLMFGMVVLIMVAALTLLHVVSNAYAEREAPIAGYELRADLAGAPVVDMEAALAEASAVGRNSFSAVGGVAFQDVQSVQLGVPRAQWQPATLAVADEGFLNGIQASMERRAASYANDQDVWAALAAQPGTAVVTARGLGQINSTADENGLQPWTVWARPQQGGQPVKLSVIGVVDARSELDDGIYTSRTTTAGLHVPVAAPRTYFFAVQPGVRSTDAAAGLQISFADQGISVTNLGEQTRIIATVRLLLTRLVQGFMGLGLLAGVAALALLGGQAVIERRQQLGTLRALGYTRRHIRTMLAIESAVIAVLGISLGVVLGLFLARSVVDLLSTTYFELRYAVPWSDIVLIIAVAWLGSTLAMLVAAWYAGRVSTADALRSGS